MCALPRAKPTADGVCPFRVLVGAGRGDCEYVLLCVLAHCECLYSGRSDFKSERAGKNNEQLFLA